MNQKNHSYSFAALIEVVQLLDFCSKVVDLLVNDMKFHLLNIDYYIQKYKLQKYVIKCSYL